LTIRFDDTLESMSRPLQIGILGAARIARLFVAGVRPSRSVAVRAVAARDVERARGFARELQIPHVHPTYEALLADPAIDAVYNPLPNSLHAEWSIRAMEAGKHVLCEKPLAASAAEARAMFEAARRNKVYLVEAYPYRAQPVTQKLRELLAAGAIGRLQMIQAYIGFSIANPADIRFDAALAGGSLMDGGSYPVSLVRMVAGARPLRVQATARWAASGVDRAMLASLDFADGLLAQVCCSFSTAAHRHAVIGGDAGAIETQFYNHTSAALPAKLEVKRGTSWEAARETIECAQTDGFLAEAESFAGLLEHGWGRWTGATPEESVDILLTLEALIASARRGGAVVEVGS
jgi:D-xylose 1-dehydrogenase (NADP+, D-xylono-1,5-lactone-forming)